MSSAVATDAKLRMRCATILASMEKAYAVRFVALEPSVRQILCSGYSLIKSWM